jgi:hypothetical protein
MFSPSGEVRGTRAKTEAPRMRDIDTIDSEVEAVAAIRRAAREQGGPLPSIAVADALLDERHELTSGDDVGN